MSSGTLKLLLALVVFVVILIAGFYPFKKKIQEKKHTDFPLGETLATGVFLGGALLHMLPEASALFVDHGYHYPFAFLIAGVFFLLFLWFEHLGKELYHHKDAHHPAFALVAWAMLSFHSLVLGAALGFTHDLSIVMMLFLAIIAHKWAESFAIAMQLAKSALNPSISLLFFLLFALMTPLGVFMGWYFEHDMSTQSLFEPILIAASAGTFFYLGTLHGLERCVMVERCCNLRYFSFVIVGFLLMAAVATQT